MRRFKIFVIVFLLVLFSLNSSFAGIEDSKFVLDQLLEGKENPDVALFVIDMQFQMLRNSIDPIEFSTIRNSQEELIAYAGSKKIPIINVIGPFQNEAGEFPILWNLMEETNHKTYYKLGDNAFNPKIKKVEPSQSELDLYTTRVSSSTAKHGSEVISEELGDYLRSKGIKNIFLMGCFDGACVSSTAEGALNEDFKVYSDRDLNLVRRLDIKEPDKVTGEPTFLSKEYCKECSDIKWEKLKSQYPNTLEVFSSEDSPLTILEPRPRSRFSRLFRSIFPCIRN